MSPIINVPENFFIMESVGWHVWMLLIVLLVVALGYCLRPIFDWAKHRGDLEIERLKINQQEKAQMREHEERLTKIRQEPIWVVKSNHDKD